jgi:hypothetical protein
VFHSFIIPRSSRVFDLFGSTSRPLSASVTSTRRSSRLEQTTRDHETTATIATTTTATTTTTTTTTTTIRPDTGHTRTTLPTLCRDARHAIPPPITAACQVALPARSIPPVPGPRASRHSCFSALLGIAQWPRRRCRHDGARARDGADGGVSFVAAAVAQAAQHHDVVSSRASNNNNNERDASGRLRQRRGKPDFDHVARVDHVDSIGHSNGAIEALDAKTVAAAVHSKD